MGRVLALIGITFKQTYNTFADIETNQVKELRNTFLLQTRPKKFWMKGDVASVDEVPFHENDLHEYAWYKRGKDVLWKHQQTKV